MNAKRIIPILFLSFLYAQNSHGAASGSWKLNEYNNVVSVDPNAEEELPLTRSLEPTNSIVFDKEFLIGTNAYYLGARNKDQGAASVVHSYVITNTSTAILNIAPETTKINGAETATDNPLYNANISGFAAMGTSLVVSTSTHNEEYTATPSGFNQLLCKISDVNAGSTISVNTVFLNDINGDNTYSITAIEATPAHIFAAVEGTNATGFTNAGIALVYESANVLTPLNAVTGAVGNLAKDLSEAWSTNQSVVAINDLHWDVATSRLYVALNITRASAAATAQLSGLLVGRLTAGTINYKIEFEPAITLSLFPVNDATRIVGFRQDNTTANRCAIHKVKTMHTSTNKSYVIVNGDVGTATSFETYVYALPMVRQEYSDSTALTVANVGKIAKLTDQRTPVAAAADMTLKTHAAAKVGQGVAVDNIEDMFVLGDTVFVCLAGSTADKKGIFQSTAVFETDGLIRTWTPWQRVMGSTDNVYGGMLDYATGNYWYLSGSSNSNKDTIKVTMWGQGDSDLLGQLCTTLPTELPQTYAGVHQLFDFDEKTTGFVTDEFSMMVATGYQKVVVIQSGKDDTVFTPLAGSEFNSTNFATNTRVFETTAIQNIGPVCCAEISRTSGATEGWIFVGGYGGWGVLRNSTSGNGWDASTGLSALSTLDTLSFKKIGTITQIRKLATNSTTLYILNPSGLYKITMSAANFKDSATTSPTLVTSPTNISELASDDSLLDFMICGNFGVLATTNGLFKINLTTEVVTEILSSESNSLGPVMHLSYTSTARGGDNTSGNLHALASNISTDLSTVVRFNIDSTSYTFSAITECKDTAAASNKDYYLPFGTFRTSYFTDGALAFNTLPKHFGDTTFLNMTNMYSNRTAIRNSIKSINLDLASTAYNIGTPVRNSASGAFIIPGDWGMRINE